MPRQHEMTQNKAALHNAVFPEHICRLLAAHFNDGCRRMRMVLRGGRILACKAIIPIFKIGKIDVHKPFQKPQAFWRFIAIGIIDDGDRKPLCFCQCQRLCCLRKEMHRRNQIDIMYAPRLLFQKDFCKTLHRNFFPKAARADLVILTKYTRKIAMGEENCPGTVLAADGWFFPMMNSNKRKFRQKGSVAAPNSAGYAIDATAMGADSAG